MQPKILPITIDLYDHTTEHKDYVLVTNDTKAYKFDFSIVSKRKPYDLSDISLISIVFKRKDGQSVYSECNIYDAVNGKVSYLVKTTEISVPGTVVAELQFYGSDGERLTSVNFTFKVRGELDGGEGIISDDRYPILTELITDVAQLESNVETKESQRQAAESTRQANETTRQQNEAIRQQQESARQQSMQNIETMWNNLSTAQQEEAEVINMRTSIARGKSFPQATDRLEEIEEEVFNPAYLTEEFTSQIHSLPPTVEKGQLSVESIKGRSLKNEANYNRDTWAEWTKPSGVVADSTGMEWTGNGTSIVASLTTQFKNNTKYGLLLYIVSSTLVDSDYFAKAGSGGTNIGNSDQSIPYTVGNKKLIFTTETVTNNRLGLYVNAAVGNKLKIRDVRVFELPPGSEIESDFETMTADELAAKYPYIAGDSVKSTISALRLTSTVNLFNKKDFITYVKTYDNTAYVTTENGHEVIEYTIHRLHDKPFMKGMFKPNTQYRFNITWRVTDGNIAYLAAKYTDGSTSDLGAVNSTTYQTNKSNSTAGKSIDYIFLSYGSPNYHARIQLDTLMITEGNQDIEYSEYGAGGSMYTKATDENGNILPMRSLPNGTKDELYEDGNGKWWNRQNVSDDTAISDTVYDSIDTATYTNVDVIKTTAFSDAKAGTTAADGMTRYYDKNGIELIEVAQADIDLETSVGKYYWHTDKTLWIIVDKGTYADISAARTGLGTTSLNYQLATPIITPANVVGHLDSHPNGTVIVEPIVADFDFYSDGIQIADVNLPIKRLDKVLWTDKETGIEVDITDTCTVAQDGLSFTSTYATEGDLIWYEYEYDSGMTTIPTVTYTAPLNSKAVLEDLVKAKSEIQNKVDNVDLRVQALNKRVDNVPVVSSFVIAPADALRKEHADLVLTGVPAYDLVAINNAITMLHTMRASVDVAIRIDFLGGTIDVGTKTDGDAIVIPLGYDNIHLYGNGVEITGVINSYSMLRNNADNVIINGFSLFNSGEYSNTLYNTGTNCTITSNNCSNEYGVALSNDGTNCTITGNTCSSDDIVLYNTGTNCTITGNICSGEYDGLYNNGNNCNISGNTCSSDNIALYNSTMSTTNKCIIIGNICINGSISVKSGTCLPASQEAMADVNTGTITIIP